MLYGVNTDPLLNDSRIQNWVKAFAPIVILDSRETAPLTSADAQLALKPELQGICQDGRRRSLQVENGRFMQRADVQSLIRDCPQELALNFRRQIPKAQNISYYSVIAEGQYLKLQFWFYYGWNDTTLLGGGPFVSQCGGHEGDWEHLSLRLNRDLLEAARTPTETWAAIDDIYLAQHARSQHPEYKWFRRQDPTLHFEGTHLLVYPGVGSHATYANPGRHELMTVAAMPVADLNDGKGLRMDVSQGQLEPVVRQAWYSFPGRWGAVQHDLCDAIEAFTPASNDGSVGPGQGSKVIDLNQGDWYDQSRPLAGP